jgi:hypothetical protein
VAKRDLVKLGGVRFPIVTFPAVPSSPRSSSRYGLFDGLHLEQASDLFFHAPGGGQFVGQRRQLTGPIAGSVFCSSGPP